MTDANIKSLTSAIILQAVRDYLSVKASPKKQEEILKDLRSPYMDFITNGQAALVAEQLERHPKEIAERLRQNTYVV